MKFNDKFWVSFPVALLLGSPPSGPNMTLDGTHTWCGGTEEGNSSRRLISCARWRRRDRTTSRGRSWGRQSCRRFEKATSKICCIRVVEGVGVEEVTLAGFVCFCSPPTQCARRVEETAWARRKLRHRREEVAERDLESDDLLLWSCFYFFLSLFSAAVWNCRRFMYKGSLKLIHSTAHLGLQRKWKVAHRKWKWAARQRERTITETEMLHPNVHYDAPETSNLDS